VYLYIDNGAVELRSAQHLWGLDGKETVKVLTKEIKTELDEKYKRFGIQKEPAMLYI
jgi:aldehyde:ferredoxin oxidoreductase